MNDFDHLRRDALVRHLTRHTSCEVRFDATGRKLYATDASIYHVMPAGVAVPRTVEDLRAAVQIALELRVPITARGGGTSLSGQSVGPGLVIDCGKHLNNVLGVDAAGRTARVQPGVVLDHLNARLAADGLLFGPDVATANRATLGGMVGNNSAGARSVVYGQTADHVRSLKMVLADGRTHDVGPASAVTGVAADGRRELRQAAAEHGDLIRERFPDIPRRVSGYNLAAYAAGAPADSLLPLLIGSEGTLGVLEEVELNLVERPRCRGLLVPHFSSLRAALEALSVCLEVGPSAAELMDTMLIDLARTQRSLKSTMAAIRGRPAALLMVEFSGDSAADVSGRVHELDRRLRGAPGLTAAVAAVEPSLRDPLWKLRSAAVPLLYGMPGDRKPVTFCEDAAVAPGRLPEFADRFRDIFNRHGTDGAFYGHASVGCLHIRPVLNLKDPDDVARMRSIMGDVTDLVREFNGSLSGEHGDGLVRSEWNAKMFGPEIYESFRRIKRAFDPENLFNPGKVVDAPAMTESLRSPRGPVADPPTVFDYSPQGGFYRSVELCNGAGVCRKTRGGAMCPSYRATRDEIDSTRGRANLLRLATVETSPRPPARRWVREAMDTCLSCKACKSECPSSVDMAKLKAEFDAAYHRAHGRPLGDYLVANIHWLNRLGSLAAPLANWANRRGPTRWLLHNLFGIDRRRSLPRFEAATFRRWFRRHAPDANAGRRGRVILLDDCFTNHNEPHVGVAAVRVLERAGYAVELADISCCGRPMISKGFLKSARRLAIEQAPRLAGRLADGVPILGTEPSCVLTLADEWPDLAGGAAARRVAGSARLIEDWLTDEAAVPGLRGGPGRLVLHGHCHQRALVGVGGSAAALRSLPRADVAELDAGCCGMAGSFGYQRRHFDLSVAVANDQLIPSLAAEPDAEIAAPGTSCRHQIRDLTGRVARHPIEYLADALAG